MGFFLLSYWISIDGAHDVSALLSMLYIYSDTLVVNCSCCCSFLFFIFIAHWHRAPAPFPQTSTVGVCAYPVTSSPFLLLLHVTQHAAPSPFSFSSKKKKGGGVWPADEKVFLFCFFFPFSGVLAKRNEERRQKWDRLTKCETCSSFPVLLSFNVSP